MDLNEQINTDDFTAGERLLISGGIMGKGQVEIMEVPVSKIKLARNSRMSVTKEEIAGLMQSIKEVGLLQPIGLTKSRGGKYEVCYGNRRFLAVSRLGKTKIPAVIHEHKNAREDDLKNLTENLQRRNISLVEAGRYMNLLNEQGLSNGEIAVRLGVTKNYVMTCLSAFTEVPEKFRKDIEVKTSNDRQKTPGKITVSAARSILTAKRAAGLDAKQTDKLFELAKSNDKFNSHDTLKYAAAVKSGIKDPVSSVESYRRIGAQFILQESEYDALYKSHIVNGPFKSMRQLFISILKGEKNISIKSVR